jgi:hypothetical protein
VDPRKGYHVTAGVSRFISSSLVGVALRCCGIVWLCADVKAQLLESPPACEVKAIIRDEFGLE